MRYIFTALCLAMLVIGFPQQRTPSGSPDARLLTGRWRSTEDKNYQIEFKAGTETEYYEKEVMSQLSYELKKDQLTAKDKKSGQVSKYAILSLTSKNLTLLYLDRGNTLRFQRE